MAFTPIILNDNVSCDFLDGCAFKLLRCKLTQVITSVNSGLSSRIWVIRSGKLTSPIRYQVPSDVSLYCKKESPGKCGEEGQRQIPEQE